MRPSKATNICGSSSERSHLAVSVSGLEGEHRFAIWAHEFKNPATGEMQVMYNGQIDAVTPGAPVKDQVATMMKAAGSDQAEATLGNLKLAPRQLVLFPNRFKGDAPDKNRPDLWSAFYPAPGVSAYGRNRIAMAMPCSVGP